MISEELPKISVIVPVYNGAKTIGQCLTSLLDQDYRQRYEIIVVDNNSTDHVESIIKSFNVILIKETQQQGPSAARNTGVKIAKGEILVFFDADQIADRTYIKNIIQGFENKQYGAFGGKCVVFVHDEDIALSDFQNVSEDRISRELNVGGQKLNLLGGGISAYRKEIFLNLNGFDTDMFSSEDFDLAIRMQQRLGLQIKFNFDAVCLHHSRNASALIKREYRIGLGDEYFTNKYPELRKNKWAIFIRLVKRTFLGVGSIVLSVFKAIPAKDKKIKIQTILQDLGMKWANFLGRMHYVLKINNRKIPADW